MAGEVAPPTLEVPAGTPPAAYRDHHGRQRPLGASGRICRASPAISGASIRCAARRKNVPRLKIEQLTLYCLSSENWKRPQTEINFLMHLLEQYMIEERATIMENNIRVRMLGRRE